MVRRDFLARFKMLLVWTVLIVNVIRGNGFESTNCVFNSMCSCSAAQDDPAILHSVSCLAVPFYKFPSIPEASISQLEVVGSLTTSLEAESLSSCQIQAFILSNNHLQYVSERAFSSSWKSLTSLDLGYNQLDGVPFVALRDLRSLQWINLHGNQVSTVTGDWSHMKSTLATLFLGENDIAEMTADSTAASPVPHQQLPHAGLRQLKGLIWLNLDGNRIHKIHKHALPPALQTVSVSHNLIENFPLDIIATIPHLQWLYLRGNQIRTIPEHTFARKLWLEKIDLSENHVKALPRKPFNNSIYIRDLNMASNDFTTITDDSFAGLDCRRIILSYNLIENVDDGAFNGIVDTLEYLDLDHNNLKQVPLAVTLLTSLKYLYLSFNSLSEISGDALENFSHSLKAISLSGNNLPQIPSETLRNCSKISYFNIGFNKIYDIEDGDFSEWGSGIQTLILNNNRITNLNGKIFADLPELRELSLSFNPLRFIETDAFYGLDGLETLELSFSMDRDDLPHEIFQSLTRLQFLSLDHNNFHEINPESFDPLRELAYLNLESNKIHLIPPKLFKPDTHSNLKDVRFCNNELAFILSDTFRSLSNLETVALSDNKIKYLQIGSFSDLPRLNKLILSDNSISRISTGAFSNLSSLTKLDLQSNQLAEISFKQFVNVTGPLFLNLSRNQMTACNSDRKMLKLEVLDLSHNHFAAIPECLEYTAFLKKLHLDFNVISSIGYNALMHLTSLEHLGLRKNKVMLIDKKAFFGLQSLQILDLSGNLIGHLHAGQFSDTPKLRVLNLSGNSLSYLPKDVFSNTLVEMIDLNYNSFSVVPSLSLADVGFTLRHLSMRSNNLEHIDITTFPDMPYLHHLDLSGNKLTILPDNVFTSLGLLQTLDLSSNPLRANFKELFHYAQSLKHLNLADTGITSTPHFPLPNLVHLNLSHNHIQAINKNAVQELNKLKVLDLSHSSLAYIPSHLWIHLPNLKSLDISYNPIKEITVDSLHGLKSLQVLNIQHLKRISKFESKALIQLRILSELSMQTWPSVEHFYDEFCYLLSHLNQLRVLRVIFIEHKLEDQLSCLTNRKITNIQITGRNLRIVEKDAFARLVRNPSLSIKISGTQLSELPSGLFSNMDKISYLSIDLSYNMLSSLNPETFYGNSTTWDNIGTTLITGGLRLAGNRFRCGCHLAWLGHWLRRWTRESLQAHNVPVELSLKVHEVAKEATCWDSSTQLHVPIIRLPPVDMSCQASALSSRARDRSTSGFMVILCIATVIVFRSC
ncbi:chaoptin [Cylas formicarius]|uniref:chaoptin n=1 Tax=Cylas formicarius TaxID=197179 RepID=UPI00295867DD|nr:chaoptin [Cylas formicarius]